VILALDRFISILGKFRKDVESGERTMQPLWLEAARARRRLPERLQQISPAKKN
jgi:hypothetical protein